MHVSPGMHSPLHAGACASPHGGSVVVLVDVVVGVTDVEDVVDDVGTDDIGATQKMTPVSEFAT